MALQNMKAIYYNLALQVEGNTMPNKIISFWYPNSASAVVRWKTDWLNPVLKGCSTEVWIKDVMSHEQINVSGFKQENKH